MALGKTQYVTFEGQLVPLKVALRLQRASFKQANVAEKLDQRRIATEAQAAAVAAPAPGQTLAKALPWVLGGAVLVVGLWLLNRKKRR